MIFDEYFQIKMNFAEDPTVTISYFKNELEYEILKIWKNLLIYYGIPEDKFKVEKSIYYHYENRKDNFKFNIRLIFDNTQTPTYYKSIGTFAGIICEFSDKLRKEIIEKEKILKRELV